MLCAACLSPLYHCVCLVCACRRRHECLFLGTGDCASSPPLRCRSASCNFPEGDDTLRAPVTHSLGCKPTSFPRHCSPHAVVTSVQTDTLSCSRDTVLRRALCQRRLREDVVAREGNSIFVLSFFLSACERVGPDSFEPCPPYPSPACVEWSKARFLVMSETRVTRSCSSRTKNMPRDPSVFHPEVLVTETVQHHMPDQRCMMYVSVQFRSRYLTRQTQLTTSENLEEGKHKTRPSSVSYRRCLFTDLISQVSFEMAASRVPSEDHGTDHF